MILGMMCTWGCEKLTIHAINNHLKIIDNIIVCVAPHHKRFVDMGDNTETIVKIHFKDNDRVTFINPDLSLSKNINCDEYKCHILNKMVKISKIKTKDILMICDVDEFYSDEAIVEIKKHFKKNNWDCLTVSDCFYVINKNWYIKSIKGHGRFFRTKHKCHFQPTQRIQPSIVNNVVIIQNNPMFHYSMLMGMKYKKDHWKCESNVRSYKLRWLEEIYGVWNPDNLELCTELVLLNKEITKHKGFWFNDQVIEPKSSPYLFRCNREHPVDITICT